MKNTENKKTLEEKILVIEDNEKHIKDAKEILGNSIIIARDFKEFEYMLNKHGNSIDGVLSDLYFPRGDSSDSPIYKGHKTETLKMLDNYINEINGFDSENPIVKSIEQYIETRFGIDGIKLNYDYEETINNLQKADSDRPKSIYDSLKATLASAKGLTGKTEETQNYQNLREEIAQDNHLLPEGMFVYQETQKRKIPCRIVTDSYHHGTDFQPFSGNVGKYFDWLTDGKKQWQGAYDSLSKSKQGEKNGN